MKKVISFAASFLLLTGMFTTAQAAVINCWFPPAWKSKPQQARAIARAMSSETGLKIKPRIAKSYPEILRAFDSPAQNLVYVGSFVQAIIKARHLGTALVQNINGKDLYSGVMVYPKGGDPEAILKASPALISFARGASSGESSAKAATGGKARVATANHGATCAAIKAGKARAGFVKNWWWEANKGKYPQLAMYEVPGISIIGNPDNVLTASNAVPAATQKKITAAAIKLKDVFGAPKMAKFDQSRLQNPLKLMKKGKIDPMTYSW